VQIVSNAFSFFETGRRGFDPVVEFVIGEDHICRFCFAQENVEDLSIPGLAIDSQPLNSVDPCEEARSRGFLIVFLFEAVLKCDIFRR
jgi:hypothetical protein